MHISKLCKKASQKLHALSRISSWISTNKLRFIMNLFFGSNFEYLLLFWMFNNRSFNGGINKFQEKVLRVTYKDRTSSIHELLKKESTFTFPQRNIEKLVTEI